ncbi:MAG: GGDEF domain-containing protein [Spirochaetota bacterium]
MIVRSARWGALLLVVAVVLLAGMGLVAVVAGPAPPASLVRIILPSVALALGILALFAGHVSYPRVQNLRVYLAGYSVGLHSIVYALLVGFSSYYAEAAPAPTAGYAHLVFAVALVLTYCYTGVPPFPTYRATRVTTWSLVAVQVVLFAAARFLPARFGFLGWLIPQQFVSIQTLVALALAIGLVVANALLRPESFYLRGSFAGLALLAAGAAILPAVLDALGFGLVSPRLIALLYACVTPLFLVGAIVAHVLARMSHRVAYDPLLQIYNREYCNQVLAEQSSVATKPPLAIMMIDIDHFKQVNDTYGHQAGDRILFAIAQAVQKAVVPEGIVCRYGGEELIVFYPGRSGRDVAPPAQRLRASIEAMETAVRSKRISVTVSIGISDRRSPRVPLRHVVHAADKALYSAKENGRNQVRFVRIKDPSEVGTRS